MNVKKGGRVCSEEVWDCEVDPCHINDDPNPDSILIKARHANLDFDELETTLSNGPSHPVKTH
jgi:hypothetical protein